MRHSCILTALDLMQAPLGYPVSSIKLHAHEAKFLASKRNWEFGSVHNSLGVVCSVIHLATEFRSTDGKVIKSIGPRLGLCRRVDGIGGRVLELKRRLARASVLRSSDSSDTQNRTLLLTVRIKKPIQY
ncbi:hypothetical protein E2542_SST26378 [Spatholobus suberectus]|nr:hypothetical protein E2542_SST26378 [Spatholobus suberectus]